MSELKLSENIRAVREAYDLTQQELGEKLDLARQTCSLYERNQRTPDVETLDKLVNMFNLSADTLLYSDLTASQLSDHKPAGHTAVQPDGGELKLNGAEARLINNFRLLSPNAQREISEIISLKLRLEDEQKGSDA